MPSTTTKTRHPSAETLSARLVRFFNVAFGRNVRGSREFVDAVSSALNDGYHEDELRLAFWVARCSAGKAAWLTEQLRGDMLPHIVLRHHGRLNNVTGKEAKRWLDDLLARAGEANPTMMKALFNQLPADMQDEEQALLVRMGMKWSDK
jgi:hypothetical protein